MKIAKFHTLTQNGHQVVGPLAIPYLKLPLNIPETCVLVLLVDFEVFFYEPQKRFWPNTFFHHHHVIIFWGGGYDHSGALFSALASQQDKAPGSR